MSTNDVDTITNQLARNAKHLGDNSWPETKDTEARDRATSNVDNTKTIIAPEDGMGRFLVSLPDGDDHQVLMVKSQSSYAGACDCDGFRYNDTPCSHLITLRFAESNLSNRDVSIPESHDYVTELTHSDAQPVDNQTQPDGGDTFEEQSISENMSNQPVTKETQQTPTEPAQSDDAFATSMPDVEDKYAIDMGGETFIRKAGYARLLKQQDWTTDPVEVLGAHETDWTRAKYRATIYDEDGKELATSVGTAGPPDREDMADADMHLDELAETRAWTRAASIATGEGLTAFAELPENASEVVDE